MFGFGKCVTPFLEVNIMPNGDVVTCRDYIDVKVGNIAENKLLDIWNNDGFSTLSASPHRKRRGCCPSARDAAASWGSERCPEVRFSFF